MGSRWWKVSREGLTRDVHANTAQQAACDAVVHWLNKGHLTAFTACTFTCAVAVESGDAAGPLVFFITATKAWRAEAALLPPEVRRG